MVSASLAFLLPPLKKGEFEQVYKGVMLAFGVKLLLGAALLVIGWKVLHWPPRLMAYSTVVAYLVALLVTTSVTLYSVKRRNT